MITPFVRGCHNEAGQGELQSPKLGRLVFFRHAVRAGRVTLPVARPARSVRSVFGFCRASPGRARLPPLIGQSSQFFRNLLEPFYPLSVSAIIAETRIRVCCEIPFHLLDAGELISQRTNLP